MIEPLNQGQIAPPSPDAGADKPDSWDQILDTVLNEDTGELQLVTADKAPEEPAQADPAGQAPARAEPIEAPTPPLDKSYQDIRAWATKVSQENAEVRRKLADIEQRTAAGDGAKDYADFVDRFTAALPEDMSEIVRDRGRFASVVARAADLLADRKVKAIRESVGSLQEGLLSMGRAVEFVASAAPDVAELAPYVQEVAQTYAHARQGADVFRDYSVNDVLAVARTIRDQRRQPSQTPQATTAPGQGPQAPPPAVQPQRDARPVSPAQRAAASSGLSVSGEDARALGQAPATGPRAFGTNVGRIIEDVMGEALSQV